MILKILQYIRGYLRIRITGYSTERFLNACSHKGIRLWNLQASGNFYEMNITIQDFRQIRSIARKTGTRVAIIRRIGLPFFFYRYRKRKLFFAGIALSVLLLAGLSQFIWNIDIRGNLTRTDEVLLDFLQTKDVMNGMRISQVDCERIVKDIRKEYNDIIWVSASIEGTKLIIQVKENEDFFEVKEDEPEENATDIVADIDCVITSVITRKGIPMIQEGMEVHKGDVLVSGQVPVNNDAKEIIGYQKQCSEADILGQTSITYEDDYPLDYIQKEDNQQMRMSEYYICIGDYRITFGTVNTSAEHYEMYSREKQLMILDNFYLPVIIGKRSIRPYDPVEKKYTKAQIRRILSDRFLRYCEDLDKKGVEIIQNDVKIYTGSKEASAQGVLTVIMPVGETKASAVPEVPEQPEEEKINESGEAKQMGIMEAVIDIPAEHEVNVFGQFDAYAKKIERTLHVTLIARDGNVKIMGDASSVEKAKKVLEQLTELSRRGNTIQEQNVNYTLALVMEDSVHNVLDIDKDIICHTLQGKPIKPKTLGQKKYVDEIRKKMIVFGLGPAGTGKTYLAMAMAITAFKNNEVGRIILTRPAIEAGEKLGFLPGDLQSKIDPYLRPLYDALYQIMGAESFIKNSEKGLIEVAPLAYMRGRTLDNAFIILDEAQNTTPAQMKMFLTRIGFGSKVVITGDETQKDLAAGQASGLDVAVKVVKQIDDIGICRLSSKDVVRHPLVQKIVKAYEEYESKPKNDNKPKSRRVEKRKS